MLVLSWPGVICFPLGRISVSSRADSWYFQLGHCVTFDFMAGFLNICIVFTFSVRLSCSCQTPPSSTMELKFLNKSAQHLCSLPTLQAAFQKPYKSSTKSLNLTAYMKNHWPAFQNFFEWMFLFAVVGKLQKHCWKLSSQMKYFFHPQITAFNPQAPSDLALFSVRKSYSSCKKRNKNFYRGFCFRYLIFTTK